MKIWMAACSKKGYEQMIKVKNLWMRQDPMTQFWTVVKCNLCRNNRFQKVFQKM